MALTVEEIVSLCYSFLLFLPFPLATQWTAFDAEVSCIQLRLVCYRFSLVSSLLKTVQEYLPSLTFSEFLSQFLLKKKKKSTWCAEVHIHCSTVCWQWFGVANLILSWQIAFLWVLSRMIHRKNLPEQSAFWTAQSGRVFFLSWPLYFRVSALNCNCVTHCMH